MEEERTAERKTKRSLGMIRTEALFAVSKRSQCHPYLTAD